MLYGNNMYHSSSKTWTNDGFCTWTNDILSINNYEISNDHILSSVKIKTKVQCAPIIPSFLYGRKIQIAFNRQVVSEIIEIVIFLARHNLSFRGRRESLSSTSSSKSNFKDMVI